MTGAERGLCQICPHEVVLDGNQTADSDLILAVSVRSDSQKAMVKFVISPIGSVGARCLPLLNPSVHHERVVAQEQMMDLEERDLGIVDLHLLRGVRAVLKDRKMDPDHQDAISRNVQLSSGLPQLQSKTTNGGPR
jgi:hypothetical protein